MKYRTLSSIAGAVLCFLLLVVGGCDSTAPSLKQLEYRPEQVLQDVYPPTVNPTNGDTATIGNGLTSYELVMGVEIDGEARAYPLNMLSGPDRQVINDELGGQTIVIAWCPICFNPQAFLRTQGDQDLTFFVPSLLWEGSLVFKDQETDTQWSMIRAEAMEGPLKGAKLAVVPSVVTTWGVWKELYPETTAIMAERSSDKYLSRLLRQREPYLVALETENGPVHWTFQELERTPMVNTEIMGQPVVIYFDVRFGVPYGFYRDFNGVELSFELRGDKIYDQEGRSWDLRSGRIEKEADGGRLERLPLLISYRQAWEKFWPKAQSAADLKPTLTTPNQ